MNFRGRHDVKKALATQRRLETQLFSATLNNTLTAEEKSALKAELDRVRLSINALVMMLERAERSEGAEVRT